MLDQKTIEAVQEAVLRAMSNKECFFLLDITNEVKRQGYGTTPASNFGSHNDMRPYAEQSSRSLAVTFEYEWALLDVKSGNEQAWLYFPRGTNTATIQSHVNRPVSPLIPVEVWAAQRSQQATGVQSQATLPLDGAKSAPPLGPIKRLGQHIIRALGKGT